MDKNEFLKTETLITTVSHKMIIEKLLAIAANQTVTCAQALALAEELGVKGKTVGQIANEQNIKIISCQLGCFGLPQEKKHGI